jgi:hypothetical protein
MNELDKLVEISKAGVNFLNLLTLFTTTMHMHSSNERSYYMEEMLRIQDIIERLQDHIDLILRDRIRLTGI